ncbi:type II toxin-antitoxin system RelE/ParE family toxin [Nitrosomonas mobilis]|uniref:RelE-like cytotoxic translational repressor of toxin-antitoxin stability system n=1 Tax=Nitrosomonas mobilis TaxID=51642 RepID=A0A1G5SHY9_9PROT|nr:type II toxin-antitoxin system RelE/ParE family toxin [Nitrosomonas mobilis]SCZ86823.1 RelE-like cytotoxic translational repressor of toxin-antitoxin stability system [Nitrosomonas mobilis]
MTYNKAMKVRPITVVELPSFLNLSRLVWTDGERAELIDYVARNPESGDLIPGTGGVRKLRWSRAGIGKRGGARVVYFYCHADAPIYMLLAYAKAVSTDLTLDQKQQVRKLTVLLKERHSVKGD